MIVQSPFYLSLDKISQNVNVVEFLMQKTIEFGDKIVLVGLLLFYQCTNRHHVM